MSFVAEIDIQTIWSGMKAEPWKLYNYLKVV